MPLPRTPGPPVSPCVCAQHLSPPPHGTAQQDQKPCAKGSTTPPSPGSPAPSRSTPDLLAESTAPKSLAQTGTLPSFPPLQHPPLSIPGLSRHRFPAQCGGHTASPQSTHLCTGWHYPSWTYITLNNPEPSSQPRTPLCSTLTHIPHPPPLAVAMHSPSPAVWHCQDTCPGTTHQELLQHTRTGMLQCEGAYFAVPQ